jgi:predicted NodU family carbamoyl transferase
MLPNGSKRTTNVPFMMQVFQIPPEKRSIIPAVNHVDRLQTVSQCTNPLYYSLIDSLPRSHRRADGAGLAGSKDAMMRG